MVKLTQIEYEVVSMLIYGHNSRAIIEWLEITNKEFLKIKYTIFRKLKITRTIQLLNVLIEKQIINFDKADLSNPAD